MTRANVAPLPLMTVGAHSHRVMLDCPVLCLAGLLSGHSLNRLLPEIGAPDREGTVGDIAYLHRPGNSARCAASGRADRRDRGNAACRRANTSR
ncbi:MAG TPA: hypothetical protein VN840_08300 [Streptosporangiaceae bacterium]|nr:hypothetical protein [Streptosporangiaceae bacterium]